MIRALTWLPRAAIRWLIDRWDAADSRIAGFYADLGHHDKENDHA